MSSHRDDQIVSLGLGSAIDRKASPTSRLILFLMTAFPALLGTESSQAVVRESILDKVDPYRSTMEGGSVAVRIGELAAVEKAR